MCLAVLDEEYADLARRAVAKLARKRPSPLVGGRRTTWAAGIVYALGQTNFLIDPESEPYASADQLSEAFGLAKSTMGSKAKQVRDLLGISPFSPDELINLIDHFILQRPLADGRTVVEVFTAEHPELTESDRELLLGWREVVEGVFEIREQAGDAIIAFNLVDELTYRVRANTGPRAFTPLRPGVFMTSRIVPVGDDWMLSGIQQLFHASARAELLKLAAELA